MLNDAKDLKAVYIVCGYAKLQECIKRAVEDENNRWETERSYEESKDSFDHNGRITVDVKQIGSRHLYGKVMDFYSVING